MPSKEILTVTELNRAAGDILEKSFPEGVWVQGEISRFTLHSSGHMYFTLKDSRCAIDAVMFKGANRHLDFKPARGVEVLVRGSISIFPPQGRYQLIASRMMEKGAGELEKKLRQLKERLFKEGLFDKKHKKKIPPVPELIGVITSPTGAAIRDILKVIRRRFSGVDIIIFPARVQGETAAKEISRGIKVLNKRYPRMDAMIIGRGGGSLEDLWAFNREEVAYAVFNSRIPVISAVGHEIDFSISDFVSDLRAPTPSAAAELIVKNRKELLDRIESIGRVMKDAVKNSIRMADSTFKSISASPFFVRPFRMLKEKYQQIDYLSGDILRGISHLVEIKMHKLTSAESKVRSLSPRRTLERGYTITSILPEKKPVSDISSLREGADIETVFSGGSLISRVRTLKRSKNGKEKKEEF